MGSWCELCQYYHSTAHEHHTAQMWVLVLDPCNWRKINYQGSESISHGFSITLRMLAMKQLWLWNVPYRGLRKQELAWGFILMNCPQHMLNFSMMVSGSIWPLLWRATPPTGKEKRERNKKWQKTCHRDNAKSVQLYRNLSPSLSWPPSLHLTVLSLAFQFPETCRGQKASSKRTVNF